MRVLDQIVAVSFAMGSCPLVLSYHLLPTGAASLGRHRKRDPAPAIGYEGATAFFLEATFLRVLLFGWGRVPLVDVLARRVAAATAMSAF